ncbi:transcription factor AP-1-like [Limulus polyphemus]|uniref:Transcription factor AP-1-like n=1 Tax=Limulus polyphemus TaxID=6850 RepID=A0ABM1BJB7_LIMPO|nr:transcription factor AP-1-like [Limulus polyphemus]
MAGLVMEATFYDEAPTRHMSDIRMLKRNMTLDFDSVKNNSRQKFDPLLTSPDLKMLKLSTPELERFITQNGGVNSTSTPSQFFPKSVTEEQDQYARGFVEALNHLHQSTAPSAGNIVPQPVPTDSMSLPSVTAVSNSTCTMLPCQPPALTQPNVTLAVSDCMQPSALDPALCATTSAQHYTVNSNVGYPICRTATTTVATSGRYFSGLVKDEPQTVPSLGQSPPPMSPIDMQDQERIKLERKRLRNRIAASKCRRRKLERIAKLEDKVTMMKGENSELGAIVNKLREQVASLKQQVLEHVNSGCQIMNSNVMCF